MSRDIKSAVVIARMLNTEGFTDTVANAVERYWRNRSGLTPRQRGLIRQLDVEFSRIMKDMPLGDRLIVGRFIGLHKKMAFDTGLKVGLQTFATRHAANVDEIEGDTQDDLKWFSGSPAAR